MSKEARRRIRAARIGRKATDETRGGGAKLSALARGRPRRKVSPETRARMIAAQRVAMRSPEVRAKISAALRCRTASPETRAKLAEAMRGNQHWRLAPIKGECVYCGDPARTFDHIIPLSRGGTDEPDNKVPACQSCNATKGDRTPEEWFAAIFATATLSPKFEEVPA